MSGSPFFFSSGSSAIHVLCEENLERILSAKTDTENSPHAGIAPPTVVFGGIGGVYGADGAFGAITGWKRR
jgi:hypothetical protein